MHVTSSPDPLVSVAARFKPEPDLWLPEITPSGDGGNNYDATAGFVRVYATWPPAAAPNTQLVEREIIPLYLLLSQQ